MLDPSLKYDLLVSRGARSTGQRREQSGFDTLSFELDGVTLFTKVSGILDSEDSLSIQDGEHETVSIPAGTHRVSWVYRTDESEFEGLDAGFVDEVTLTKPTPGQGGEPGPNVEFTASGQKLRLRWTDAAAASFQLQSSPSLTNPDWQDVAANEISEGDGEFFIPVGTAVGTKFYRLVEQ